MFSVARFDSFNKQNKFRGFIQTGNYNKNKNNKNLISFKDKN